MNPLLHQKLLDFLIQQFNPDDTIHFLVISAIKPEQEDADLVITLQVRVALTSQDNSGITPYFDGTDLFVAVTPEDIRFTREEEWADGPPICEGSPIELAMGWVSELAPPFFVSPEAQEAADRHASSTSDLPPPTPPTDPNPRF